ncbi:ribonuclease H [Senna tora]|uniref:Ribonuclease H n=1 Tax=Senna tora TaxID=362788 RepID=A0A834SP18_9FABA|nr:ribonuclease H [Senna tora]
MHWIGWNLQRNYNFASISWPSIFSVACGLISHWKNEKHFDADFQIPNEVHRVILYHAKFADLQERLVVVVLFAIIMGIGLRDLKVELGSDSSQAIKMFQMLREAGSHLRLLQHKISCLLASDWEVKAMHIPRNANGCADTIAKHSLTSSIGFNMLDNHPSVVVSVMLRDANNNIIHDPVG